MERLRPVRQQRLVSPFSQAIQAKRGCSIVLLTTWEVRLPPED